MTGLDGTKEGVYNLGKFLMNKDYLIFQKFTPLPLPLYPPTQPTCDWFSCTPMFDSHDIACEPNSNERTITVWVACGGTDNNSAVLKAFETKIQIVEEAQITPPAKLLDSIPASIGIGTDVWGLAFEKNTKRYLWVGNETTKKIYKVDIDAPTQITQQLKVPGLSPNEIIIHKVSGIYKIRIPVKGGHTASMEDYKGKTIVSWGGSEDTSFNISEKQLAAGMYVIRVKTSDGMVAKKIAVVK